MYEVVIERDNRILKLGREENIQKAVEKVQNYIRNAGDSEYDIWIEEVKE